MRCGGGGDLSCSRRRGRSRNNSALSSGNLKPSARKKKQTISLFSLYLQIPISIAIFASISCSLLARPPASRIQLCVLSVSASTTQRCCCPSFFPGFFSQPSAIVPPPHNPPKSITRLPSARSNVIAWPPLLGPETKNERERRRDSSQQALSSIAAAWTATDAHDELPQLSSVWRRPRPGILHARPAPPSSARLSAAKWISPGPAVALRPTACQTTHYRPVSFSIAVCPAARWVLPCAAAATASERSSPARASRRAAHSLGQWLPATNSGRAARAHRSLRRHGQVFARAAPGHDRPTAEPQDE